MRIPRLFGRSCKDSSAYNNSPKGLGHTGSNLTTAIAYIAAAGLVISSAGFAGLFAWQTGLHHGWAMAVLFVVFAICLDLSKPLAISAMFQAVRDWAFVRAAALALLAATAVAYSLTAEVTLMSMARMDLVAQRAADARSGKSTEGQRTRIETELAKLANVRPAATVKAEIVGLLADPRLGDCAVLDGPRTKATCPRVNALRAELGGAERREKLESDLAKLPTGGAAAATERPADPGAHAVRVFLGAIGLPVPSGLSEWLAMVGVIALEVGSALAGLLVASVGGASGHPAVPLAEPSSERRAEAQPATRQSTASPVEPAQSGDQPDPNKPTKRTKKRPAKRTTRDAKKRLGNVVRLVQASGGKVTASQQSMATQLRLSKTRTHELLRELEGAGVVKLKTSKRGTTVALVA